MVKLGPDGEVLNRIEGGGLHRPMGLATDSRGNVWVGNSTWVVAPCVGQFHPEGGPGRGGSVTLIKSNGNGPDAEPVSKAAGSKTPGASRSTATTTSGSPTSAAAA